MAAKDPKSVEDGRRWLNPTLIALLAGVVVLLALIWFFASNRDPDQDKLSENQLVATEAVPDQSKRCSVQATYDLIKRELFRRAAELRGSDQAAYDNLAGFAVVRMENPVLESESNGTLNCSGSLSLDLPPGVAATGGRRTLTADVDYTIEQGGNVTLRNADAIIAPLATLARVAQTPPATSETNQVAPEEPGGNAAASESANIQPGPPGTSAGRPSFDCAAARTRGETMVCADSGLSALDLNMSTQYRRALGAATPAQKQLLQSTRNRFLAFRDGCPDRRCIANAYLGRMREIRDIMEGRWQPSR